MRARLTLTSCLLTLSACVCGTGTETREYFCTASDQCVAGYHCDAPAQTCIADGTGGSGGGSVGGGSGGGAVGGGSGTDSGLDAGPQDAGADAGGNDAGTVDAGIDAGIDAGPPDAGPPDAGGVIGARCTLASDCQNNRCRDGRCCSTDCSGACDFCDAPGDEGKCSVAPAGRTPSVACSGGYACNGTSSACPNTCNSDAGCVGARCASGQCILKLEQLKDDFASGTFDRAIWGGVDLGCAVVNQQYQVSTFPLTTRYPAITSQRRYDLLDSELKFDLVDAGDQTIPTMQAYAGGCDALTSTRCLQVIVSGGTIFIQLGDNGVYSDVISSTPLGDLHTLRMREAAGTLYLEGRTDAGVWLGLGSAPTPLSASFSDMYIGIGSGTYQAQPTGSTVIFDNINSP